MDTNAFFVGRQVERSQFSQLLNLPYSGNKLIYVWGPGGIGKTWLLKAMMNDARNFPKQKIRVAKELIDVYKTNVRHIEGFIESLIDSLSIQVDELKNYHLEKANLKKLRLKEDYAKIGIDTQLSKLTSAFRRDLNQICQRQKVVIAIDTFEHIKDSTVGSWVMSENGLQMHGLICIIGSRSPMMTKNSFNINLGGISDEDAFKLYNLYFPLPIGERDLDDEIYTTRLNKVANGNPLLLGLALYWLDMEGLREHELEALDSIEFQRRISAWLRSKTNKFRGFLFPYSVPIHLHEPLRQTLIFIAYLNRRFNRFLLDQLVRNNYIRDADPNDLWAILTSNQLPDFFYVKNRPDGEIQLHDKLAEILRINVLPFLFDDMTGRQLRQFASDVVDWYETLIRDVDKDNEQQWAVLELERLAYTLRLDILIDTNRPEWRVSSEGKRLSKLLPPDFSTAKNLLIEYRLKNLDLLNRLIINEVSTEIVAQFPLVNRYVILSLFKVTPIVKTENGAI